MKKKAAILISILMVMTFAFAACGGGGSSAPAGESPDSGEASGESSDGSKYVGVWQTGEIIIVGETDAISGTPTLTLNADGTGNFADDLTVRNFTWEPTKDGFKTEGDIDLDFRYDGDTITGKIMSAEMVFTKLDENAGEVIDYVDGKAYGYGGDDPAVAACYEYMAETVAKQYDAADVSIPSVTIVSTDDTSADEILVAGDFWIFNYNIDGDTLKCVSGGNYPGVMHVSKDTYRVTDFDQVADGGGFDESAKELFGDNYDAFMDIYGDEVSREESRKLTIKDYVHYNSLEITKYQDEGWDPVELPKY